ncbi:hypothetical protein CEXT_493981 [Caerostris extrusa]|uniref:Uncharacterized protein n=1 Tax=Caerostris extrusa TaxID=172846 RepID=A0AAV4TM13_CAEEX|nr:hypothetical protein CEXT_493981 [Caerostris extrusa]
MSLPLQAREPQFRALIVNKSCSTARTVEPSKGQRKDMKSTVDLTLNPVAVPSIEKTSADSHQEIKQKIIHKVKPEEWIPCLNG